MAKPTKQSHVEQANLRETRSQNLAIVDLQVPLTRPPIRTGQSVGRIGHHTVTTSTPNHRTGPFRTLASGMFGRIEIVIVATTHRAKNVAINLDPELIQGILRQRFSQVDITTVTHRKDLEALAKRQPDLVFSGVKYFHFNGEVLWLNEFLDQHQIPYIGSSKQALDREYDKTIAKELIHRAGLKTAAYAMVRPGDKTLCLTADMHFPVFIKPADCGDSIGIDAASLAHNTDDMNKKIRQLFDQLGANVLVEQYLPGKEYSIGVIEDDFTKTLSAMPIEIRTDANQHGHRILDFQTKQNDAEEVLPVTMGPVHHQLSDLGKAVFRVLGGRSFGRIDVRMCASGIPHFMEANLMPGLKKGYFYRCCSLNLGLSYEQMIIGLAENRIRVSVAPNGLPLSDQTHTADGLLTL